MSHTFRVEHNTIRDDDVTPIEVYVVPRTFHVEHDYVDGDVTRIPVDVVLCCVVYVPC